MHLGLTASASIWPTLETTGQISPILGRSATAKWRTLRAANGYGTHREACEPGGERKSFAAEREV